MTKRKGSQKAESEKVRCKNLEGREIKKLALEGHPSIESQQEAFREIAQKEENYEKKGKCQSSKWLAQRGLWYLGKQGRGISGTLEP